MRAQARHKASSHLPERIITMIENIINKLYGAFGQVVTLVGEGFDGVFEAVNTLSSNVF